ncbi:TPR repeat-containing CheR-type MCP methyltransferase [Calothrix sp. NIES-4071]|nr:TPR repeat-containing CheR-type MCP methyltransferase [Calothrix sp. NIES-4071]BAZ55108.1 TPR repeat-containing CheR-type MCP methyltransferase [Calothrix sp. NIES-4105]
MSLTAIESLLSKKIGVDFKIIGDSKITKAVENRRLICGITDLKAYLQLLQTSQEEFSELVEQIVVPETYFFRDRKSFDFLQMVAKEWLAKPNHAILRLLSVPCSTGEEPYSIAIALIEAGLTTSQFGIDAIDISKQAISKAQRAIYGKNSFRGQEFVDRHRYFRQIKEGYEVCDEVRNLVNFRQGNLLDTFKTAPAKYDIIFCRNLLIYLEPPACTQVFNILHRLLQPSGLLFVGAAETAKTPSNLFTSVRQSSTFAYRKSSAVKSQSPEVKTAPTFTKPRQKPEKILSSPVTASNNAPSLIELAKQLADAGHVEAAINHCNDYLKRETSTNAEAHTLLGTLYQAKANYIQAEQSFRKALYLNPNDYEALMHLALLKEHFGDIAGASILKQRIHNLKGNN